MDKNYNFSSENISKQSDLTFFTNKTKDFIISVVTKFRTYVIPNIIKLLYKLSILKDIDQELNCDEQLESEYSFKIVNACNHAKQISLLDMAAFTSPELQNCIIHEKTLKETVIEFQVVKSKFFIENRSVKGNFLYEGALLEQICNHLNAMTPSLKKVYLDFFKQEVYQYLCNSYLDIDFLDLYDQKWMDKICEKLIVNDSEEVLNAEYPKGVLNKFRFIYMLIKVQEIKYEKITKSVKSQE